MKAVRELLEKAKRTLGSGNRASIRTRDSDLLANFWFGEPYESRGLEFRLGKSHSTFCAEASIDDEDGDLHFRFVFLKIGTRATVRRFVPWAVRNKWYEKAKERRARIVEKAKTLGHGDSIPHHYELTPLGRTLFGVSIFESRCSLDIYRNDSAWSSIDKDFLPWEANGWTWSFDWKELLLGETKVEDGEVRSEDVNVVLPEGIYKAVVTSQQRRWQNQRSPIPAPWEWQQEIKIVEGTPAPAIPGKGTASHNLDDSATHSMSYAATKEPVFAWQIAKRFALDVLATRSKRASLDWVPSEGWPDLSRNEPVEA